jgi:AcrR family transcriptional regulator
VTRSRIIWLRDEPSPPRPAHTRAEITAAALEVADRHGFEAVSMRRVARELGAGTMTLYHYVRSKDELIALMVDAVVGETLVPDDELATDDWRVAMSQIAVRTREAFRRRRWALDRLDDGPPVPNGIRGFEQSLRACSGLKLGMETKFELISLVSDYVFGFTLREAREFEIEEHSGWKPEVLWLIRHQLDTEDLPELRGFFGTDIEAGFEWAGRLFLGKDRFERGLGLLLDGIAAGLEIRVSGTAATA